MPSPLDQPEQPTPAEHNDNEVQDQTVIDQPPQPLAIEYGEATQTATDASTTDETVHKLDLGQGDVVKLDALGPMIINTDGVRSPSSIIRNVPLTSPQTLSRIQNWHELTEFEQERTVRVLVKKRNVVRLQKLRDDEAALDKQSAVDDGDQAGS
jgi:hypothetical protein